MRNEELKEAKLVKTLVPWWLSTIKKEINDTIEYKKKKNSYFKISHFNIFDYATPQIKKKKVWAS